jgi:hypothetical protein
VLKYSTRVEFDPGLLTDYAGSMPFQVFRFLGQIQKDLRMKFTRTIALILVAIAAASSFAVLQAGEPVTLFDGKTLKNFDVLNCEVEVKDGAILLKAGNGLVQLKKQYTDFVLDYEWKALHPEMWDSGVYFRYAEVPKGRPWPKRYQVNLRKGMEGELGGFRETKGKVATKLGDWNRFELTVKGGTASLKSNGKQSWKVDGIEDPKGYIAIQAEVPGGGQFLFRNIRITDLSKK